MRFLEKLKETGYCFLFGIACYIIMAAINSVFHFLPLPPELTVSPSWFLWIVGAALLFYMPVIWERMEGITYSNDALDYWIRFGCVLASFAILSLIFWGSVSLAQLTIG